MKITIGADELILWLRKNKKTVGIENLLLGRRIAELVKKLGGEFAQENQPSLWSDELSDEAMTRMGLPKTAQQYMVDISTLPEVYKTLNEW